MSQSRRFTGVCRVPCLLLWLTFSLPSLALAEGDQAPDEATMMAAQDAVVVGRAHFKAQRWREGITAYERAYALFPQVEHLLVIAKAHEKIPGGCKEAIGAWSRYLEACGLCDGRGPALLRVEAMTQACQAAAPRGPSPLEVAREALSDAETHRREGRHLAAAKAYERAHGAHADAAYLYEAALAYAAAAGRCVETRKAWVRFLDACGACPRRDAGEAGLRTAEAICPAPGTRVGGADRKASASQEDSRLRLILGGGGSLGVEGGRPARGTEGHGLTFTGGLGWSHVARARFELSLEAHLHVDFQDLRHAPPETRSALLLLSVNVPLLLRRVLVETDGLELRLGVGLKPRLLLAAVSDVFAELDTSFVTLRLPLSLEVFFPSGGGGYGIELRADQQLTALIPTYGFRSVTALVGIRL